MGESYKKNKKEREPWRVMRNGSVEVLIYKEDDGYRIAWYFGGVRHRKFCADPKKAVNFAEKKASSLGTGQPLTSEEILAKLRYFEQLEEQMDGFPLHIAVEEFKRNRLRTKLEPAKCGLLLDAFIERLREDGMSPSYIGAAEKYCRPFVDGFPVPIHTIASDDIDEWIRKRTSSKHSRHHIANYLRTFFNWCRDAKKALPRGETEADLVVMPDPKPGEIEIYTPREMALLFQYAKDEEDIALLALGGFAGLRMSEITGEDTDHGPLPAENILFDDLAVKVVQKVQRKSVFRYAPIPANGISWLEPFRGKAGPIVGFKRADYRLASIIDRAKSAGEKISKKRNGLRRSHISYRMALTRNAALVGDECNTSPEKIRLNYRKPGLERIAHQFYGIFRHPTFPAPFGPLSSIDAAKLAAQSEEM